MGPTFETLLARTSRTFALAIPLLPEPRRSEVGLAYLLLRAADTLEDAATWTRDERIDALRAFGRLLAGDRTEAAALGHAWAERRPVADEACLSLLAALPGLLAEVDALSPGPRAVVLRYCARTVDGMAVVLERSPASGRVELGSLAELREYCYAVAGIVGELLTELFLHDPRVVRIAEPLRAHALHFGEALQLVNILKDADADAREGRSFLRDARVRAEAFALARSDLAAARRYVSLLRSVHAERGEVAFTALPVLLAEAALDRVAVDGPGAKVSREEVVAIAVALNDALDADRSPFAEPSHVTLPGVA